MPLEVTLTSSTSTIHLVNSNGSPTVGGSPASAATTPYSLNASEWTQTAAPAQTVYSGGPPFGFGAQLRYLGYGNVTETVEIGIAASSANNAAELIRTLRQTLNYTLTAEPARLFVRPHNASQGVTFEVYHADVQEVGDWQNPVAGFTNILCRVTWTRSPTGSIVTKGFVRLNAASYGFSGGNTAGLGTDTFLGDIVYQRGNPLNVELYNATVGGPIRAYVGTTFGFVNQTGPGAVAVSGSTISAPAIYSGSGSGTIANVDRALTHRNYQVRVVFQVENTSLSDKFELQYRVRDRTNTVTLYESPWVPVPPQVGSNQRYFIDAGAWDVSQLWQYSNLTDGDVALQPRYRSADGSAVTVDVRAVYWMLYLSWGIADWDRVSIGATSPYSIDTFYERSLRPCVPYGAPRLYANSVTVEPFSSGYMRGRAPIYVPDHQLTIFWGGKFTNGTYPNYLIWLNDTLTVTARQAPQYLTLRGNG